jgi:hypothetical protein
MNNVQWGRPGTMGPDQPHWPDTYPVEAAHAASEITDDDGNDGAVVVTALGAGLLTLLAVGVAALLWSVW